MFCADSRVAELENETLALEDKLEAMALRAEAAEGEKAKLAEGLTRKGHEQEEASDAALQALAEKRCALWPSTNGPTCSWAVTSTFLYQAEALGSSIGDGDGMRALSMSRDGDLLFSPATLLGMLSRCGSVFLQGSSLEIGSLLAPTRQHVYWSVGM